MLAQRPSIPRRALAIFLVPMLASCQSFGPSRQNLLNASHVPAGPIEPASDIKVIKVQAGMVHEFQRPDVWPPFASVLGGARPVGSLVGIGDVLEVTILEAPPAALFGGGAYDGRVGVGVSGTRANLIPETMVGPDGTLTVPFAGRVDANGKTLSEIQDAIASRLVGKANTPQVLVRLVRNVTATATVIGEVGQAVRLPLTPAGERVLDAIAAAGGVKQPVNMVTIQISRAGVSHRMVLSDIIDKGENNVVLAKNDVVTALYQPYSFTALGAAGRNEEIRFEAFGITLSQALGRLGGLQDGRANPRGVFLFRWEGPAVPGPRKPVIYSFDLKDPSVFFLAQQFQVNDRDVIYVTNAPMAELSRFIGLISQTIFPISAVNSIVKQ